MTDYDKSFQIDGCAGPIDQKTAPLLEVGSRVDYAGMEGTVISIDEDVWHEFPVSIKFDNGLVIVFTADGKQFRQQKHSLLKVIGQAPVMVKKWQWVCRHTINGYWYIWSELLTDQEADETFLKPYQKIEASEVEVPV